MAAPAVAAQRKHPDAPESEDDRYAVYVVNPKAHGRTVATRIAEHMTQPTRDRRRVYMTDRDGIGLCLCTLHDEGEVPRGWRIGIFDREQRFWIVNPFV